MTKFLSERNEILISQEKIQDRIFTIRGTLVMLDRDLAELYGVGTKVLNQAVKRNEDRFPLDFRFQLTLNEKNELVTICDRFESMKHSSVNPHAFTEHGVLMLANVLRSDLATKVSIRLIRIFVQLRQMLSNHSELKLEIELIKKKLGNHDKNIEVVFQYLDELMDKKPQQESPTKKIGFEVGRK